MQVYLNSPVKCARLLASGADPTAKAEVSPLFVHFLASLYSLERTCFFTHTCIQWDQLTPAYRAISLNYTKLAALLGILPLIIFISFSLAQVCSQLFNKHFFVSFLLIYFYFIVDNFTLKMHYCFYILNSLFSLLYVLFVLKITLYV